MESTRTTLNECTEIDFRNHDDVVRVFRAVPEKVGQTDWPDDQKRGYLQGFQSSSQAQLNRLDQQNRVEKLWASATLELYDFAIKNARAISVRDGKIAVTDSKLRDAFNQKLHRANDLHNNFLMITGQIEDSRKQSMRENSLSEQDFAPKKQ